MKLYRVWNEKEDKLLNEGILSCEIKKTLIGNTFNTFFYEGNDAYRKHFFLFKEDAFIYSKYLDCEEKYVFVFSIPEELVFKNLGLANVRDEFFPLDVAITAKEIKDTFNLKSVDNNNPLEYLYINNSDIYIGEEQMNTEKSFSYKNINHMLNSILVNFYEDEEISIEKARLFFADEENKKMIMEKIKK